jgi:hypothetical protein
VGALRIQTQDATLIGILVLVGSGSNLDGSDRNLRWLDRDGIDSNLADYPDHSDGPNSPNKETLKAP